MVEAATDRFGDDSLGDDQLGDDPFGDDPLDEVPLSQTPLRRSLAQIRFPRLTALVAQRDEIPAAFAAAIRNDYPLFGESQGLSVSITQEGMSLGAGTDPVWRLRDTNGEWQASFGSTFLALDTSSYVDRQDFVQRISRVLIPFLKIVEPPYCERIGVRYINQAKTPEPLSDLTRIIRPELLSGMSLGGRLDLLQHSVSESSYRLSDDRGLQVRWGLLPPDTVLDPSVQPLTSRSWVLDVDSYCTRPADAEAGKILKSVEDLALGAYRFFRWAVTQEFLSRAGGTT